MQLEIGATSVSGSFDTIAYEYGDDDQVTKVKVAGVDTAVVTYDATGRPVRYTYSNGTTSKGLDANGNRVADLQFDSLGRPTGIAWVQPDGTTVITSDQITSRSNAGRIADRKADGTDPNPAGANYLYDGAGRLIDAYIGGNRYQYEFASSGGCGASTAAGKNTNRTKQTVNGTAITTYCYDNADRLTSSNPGTATNYSYDSHGNIATIDLPGATDEIHGYDALNRHLKTTKGSTVVEYVRDAGGNVIERRENGAVANRYSGSAVLDASSNVVALTIALPGGAMFTKQTSGDVWSYPNAQGSVAAIANASGVKQGSTFQYDPYGVAIGTLPNNAPGNFDNAWIGVQRTETASGLTPRIEMGARQYMPDLGRFMSTDPIEGGSANDYEYGLGDPINNRDPNGTCTSIANCFGTLALGSFLLYIAKMTGNVGRVTDESFWGGAHRATTFHFTWITTAALFFITDGINGILQHPFWSALVVGVIAGAACVYVSGPWGVLCGAIVGAFYALFSDSLNNAYNRRQCLWISAHTVGTGFPWITMGEERC